MAAAPGLESSCNNARRGRDAEHFPTAKRKRIRSGESDSEDDENGDSAAEQPVTKKVSLSAIDLSRVMLSNSQAAGRAERVALLDAGSSVWKGNEEERAEVLNLCVCFVCLCVFVCVCAGDRQKNKGTKS